MPRSPRTTLESRPGDTSDVPSLETAPSAESATDDPVLPAPKEIIDGQGRKRVLLPDLPHADEYYVRNKTNSWHDVSSQKGDVPNLVIGPNREIPLPDHAFWFAHPRFRKLIEETPGDFGQTEPAPLEVYQQVKTFLPSRDVPTAIKTDERYTAYIETLVHGPWSDALELIELDPVFHNGRRDLHFLVKTWCKVLEHARFVLEDMRRAGREVDSRRIDGLGARIAQIDDWRREAGISRTAD